MYIPNKIKKIFSKPVTFEDSLRIKPISSQFGFDRGTPIDRYYIEKFLQKHAPQIKGNVLEISESTYSIKFGNQITSFEILHFDDSNRKATIIGDLTDTTTLPENKIDCFICTQTFNFIYEVRKAIAGSYHLLKSGGVLLATVSGLSQISRYDMDRWGDYWRFTDISAKRLFEECFGNANVEIETFGNVLAAKAFLDGLAVEDLPESTLLDAVDKDYQITIGIKAVKKVI
ncbi:MAG: class I SAM-dependent methyltransferase [Tannerella sp.]|nr:class I SAM-dependent methyltransferase [Tannerella sp.]